VSSNTAARRTPHTRRVPRQRQQGQLQAPRPWTCLSCQVAWVGSATCWSCGRPVTTAHPTTVRALNALYRLPGKDS
jgi:hypothetical protein